MRPSGIFMGLKSVVLPAQYAKRSSKLLPLHRRHPPGTATHLSSKAGNSSSLTDSTNLSFFPGNCGRCATPPTRDSCKLPIESNELQIRSFLIACKGPTVRKCHLHCPRISCTPDSGIPGRSASKRSRMEILPKFPPTSVLRVPHFA